MRVLETNTCIIQKHKVVKVMCIFSKDYISSLRIYINKFSLTIDLRFINQTNKQTIVGQEGSELDINCASETGQYITALKLESNGTVNAIGDHQNVNFSFIPDRTDHLTKYRCVDSSHSSLMVEVELSIRCKYVEACTNSTFFVI